MKHAIFRQPWRIPIVLLLMFSTLLDSVSAIRALSGTFNINGQGLCDENSTTLTNLAQAYTIQLPVDHFHNDSQYAPHSKKSFANRYWFNDTWYKPGGPIIVLNAGEDDAIYSLPYMQIGLLHDLAKATNGLAVTLEHRYYGKSVPVKVKTAADLRFLTVEQAMADQAYFAQHVVFAGHEDKNLTASNTPWFAIGCSYSGALTAFERVQYPDLFWGALSSSGVTAPHVDNWEYENVVREYGPAECTSNWGKIINIIDNILLGENATQKQELKSLLDGSSYSDAYFAASLSFDWILQYHNWLPCRNQYENQPGYFCAIMTAPNLKYPKNSTIHREVEQIVISGGWANESATLTTVLLNYIGWFQDHDSAPSFPDAGQDPSFVPPYEAPDQFYWQYQQCTQFGGFQTGDTPRSIEGLPLTSRLVTEGYFQNGCHDFFNTSWPPDINSFAQYGYENVSYQRLFISGGEEDPWRPSTPLAINQTHPTRLNYSSTLEQPWVLMQGATHCWDFYGAFADQKQPPKVVKDAQEMEMAAFQRWLGEWHDAHQGYDPYFR